MKNIDDDIVYNVNKIASSYVFKIDSIKNISLLKNEISDYFLNTYNLSLDIDVTTRQGNILITYPNITSFSFLLRSKKLEHIRRILNDRKN